MRIIVDLQAQKVNRGVYGYVGLVYGYVGLVVDLLGAMMDQVGKALGGGG